MINNGIYGQQFKTNAKTQYCKYQLFFLVNSFSGIFSHCLIEAFISIV